MNRSYSVYIHVQVVYCVLQDGRIDCRFGESLTDFRLLSIFWCCMDGFKWDDIPVIIVDDAFIKKKEDEIIH